MSGHTPGPWIFEDGDEGDASVGMGPTPPVVYSDPQEDGNVFPICTIDEPLRRADREPEHEYDECMEQSGDYRANARLIAAAPEMLEALKELLLANAAKFPDYEEGVEAQQRWAARKCEAEKKARDAIAKAEAS